MNLSSEQIAKFAKAASDDNAVFCFVPSSLLREKLSSGLDLILSQLPEGMPRIILECPSGQGIRIDGSLVLRYLEGKLDQKNTYLLGLGEILVLNSGDMKIGLKNFPSKFLDS